jgi:hypothetical protein
VAFREAPRGLDGAHDVLKVANAAGEPVNAGDHENVAGPEEIENRPQFLAAFRRGAAALVGANNLAPCRLQRRLLDGKT